MKRCCTRALKSSAILHSWQLETALNWIAVITFVFTAFTDLLLTMRNLFDTMAGHTAANLLLPLAVLVLVHSVCV